RADLYSLGGTLYYLLTGEPPLKGSDRSNLAKKHARLCEPAPDVRQRRDGVPEALRIVLDRLLARDPDYRFATPTELCTGIKPLTAGCKLRALLPRGRSPVSSSGAAAVGATSDKSAGLSPWQIGVLVFLGLLLALGLYALWPSFWQDSDGRPDVPLDNREHP